VVSPAGRTRVALDVAELPDVAFGHRDIMWWGTVGFMVIEGTTLALCAVVFLYLWKNFQSWPPAGTELPTLGIPSAHLALMLLSLPVVRWLEHAARDFDVRRVRLGLLVATAFGVAFVALRFAELLVALHVKWDTNAYGSAQWLVLGLHGTLLLVELVEVAGFALFFWVSAPEEKHLSDVADVALYWYFMVLAWVPLYLICFWGPRWTS
jgi:cytochrome c oxidase subunit I+III